MPDVFGGGWIGLGMEVFVDGVPRIVVAIAAWEDYDADFHVGKFEFSKGAGPDSRAGQRATGF